MENTSVDEDIKHLVIDQRMAATSFSADAQTSESPISDAGTSSAEASPKDTGGRSRMTGWMSLDDAAKRAPKAAGVYEIMLFNEKEEKFIHAVDNLSGWFNSYRKGDLKDWNFVSSQIWRPELRGDIRIRYRKMPTIEEASATEKFRLEKFKTNHYGQEPAWNIDNRRDVIS